MLRLRARVRALDERVERWAAPLRGRAVPDHLAYGLTALADHGLAWLLVGVARGWRSPPRRRAALFAVGYTGVLSPGVNAAVKHVVGRARPPGGDQDHPLPVRVPRSASFPSGHTLAAWSAAHLLATEDPLAPAYYALATLVAWSRLHVRMHHASDVVGGALLGLALGESGRRLRRRSGDRHRPADRGGCRQRRHRGA